MAKLKEFRSQKQAEIAKVQGKIKKRNKRFYVLFGIVIILVAIAFFGARLFDNSNIEKHYQEYISSSGDRYQELSEDLLLLQYKDSSTYYEAKSLFNSNANTIDYGAYCDNGGLVLESTSEGLILTKDGQTQNIAGQTSYNGLFDGYAYFRDDSDLGLYKYNISTGEKVRLIKDNAGEVIVSDDGIFYINLSKGNHIYKLDGVNDTEYIADSVKAFAVVGKTIVFLTQDNILEYLGFNSTNPVMVQDKIKNFSFADKIIAENNGKLIEFTINGNDSRVLYEGNATLISANKHNVIFTEDKKLWILDRDTMKIKDYDISEIDVCKSVYFKGDEIKIVGYKKTTDGNFEVQYISKQK